VRMGAGPRRCSSPDIPDLARRMALQSLLPFLVGGRSSEDGDRRYVARSEQAARLARPKGAALTSRSQIWQPCP